MPGSEDARRGWTMLLSARRVIGAQRAAVQVALDHQPVRRCGGPRCRTRRGSRTTAGTVLVLRAAPRAAACRSGEKRDSSMSRNAIQRASSRCAPQAVVERGESPRPAAVAEERRRPVVHDRDARGDIRREHLAMVVGAAVVVEEEALHPDQAVELDPLARGRRRRHGRSCRRRGSGCSASSSRTASHDAPAPRGPPGHHQRAGVIGDGMCPVHPLRVPEQPRVAHAPGPVAGAAGSPARGARPRSTALPCYGAPLPTWTSNGAHAAGPR